MKMRVNGNNIMNVCKYIFSLIFHASLGSSCGAHLYQKAPCLPVRCFLAHDHLPPPPYSLAHPPPSTSGLLTLVHSMIFSFKVTVLILDIMLPMRVPCHCVFGSAGLSNGNAVFFPTQCENLNPLPLFLFSCCAAEGTKGLLPAKLVPYH